jgi:molybdopterin/thiamine biosynthesis adenylyltransferase
MKKERVARYSRQLVLEDIGPSGQKRLSNANVAIVGCGGLGSPVIQYLAAAGIGNMRLYDDDKIELSNLNRQILFNTSDIGYAKSEVAANYVKKLNPHVNVTSSNERITLWNVESLFNSNDLVIDCTDGLLNKMLLNDAAVLTGTPLLHSSALMMAGRWMWVLPGTACLRCLFPEMPAQNSMPLCRDSGILGAICGVVGCSVAVEAIKYIVLPTAENANKYFIFNMNHTAALSVVELDMLTDCRRCSNQQRAAPLIEGDYQLQTGTCDNAA